MSQARPLLGFNGLRALACLSVLLYHLNQHRSVANLTEWNWNLYQFVEMWPVAVSLFFMLSAVTNSLPFWRALIRNGDMPNIREHMMGRFFRIAPAYYFVLIITFIWVLLIDGTSEGMWVRLFAGLTFLSWVHPFTFFPVDINGPLWYISYDMMWVVLVMFTMYLVSRVKKIYIPVVFLLLITFLVAWHFLFTKIPFPVLDGVVSEWFPAYNPFIFGLHFLIWVMVAWFLVWREKKHAHASIWYDVLCIIWSVWLFYFLWRIREAGDFEYTLFHSPHRFPFATLPIAFLIMFVPYTRYIGKALDNRFFQHIARLSYSTYLWHAIIIVLMTRFIFGWVHDLPMSQWLILAMVTIIGSFSIAWLSYHYIEIPISNWWRTYKERQDNTPLSNP